MTVKFKEEQLVRINYIANIDTGEIISTNTDYNHTREHKLDSNTRMFKTWIRVKFIDNDDTFAGEVERVESNRWSEIDINVLEKNSHHRFSADRVDGTEDLSKDFCYSDNVAQCNCPGTCRNK